MTTVAIACTTGVYALLFSRLSGREGTRCKIGVARIECANTQRQKHCEEKGDDGKRPFATFHGSTPFRSKKTKSLERRRKVVMSLFAPDDDTLPHKQKQLCTTANEPAEMTRWVNKDALDARQEYPLLLR
jgi:hypothetical protein